MTSSTITLFICLLAFTTLNESTAKRPRAIGLPVPTSETIPLVAEVMGAASYEETLEPEESPPDGQGKDVKRVQRKLTDPQETDRDLDPEQLEFHEYQGVMGRPGIDFPVLPKIPRTDFSCRKVKSSGYYADLETGCQVFHICDGGRKISFLCPNGTIFRQSHLICDWWFRVNCEKSVDLYEESAEQLAHDQMVYKKRAEEIAKVMANGRTPAPTAPTISTPPATTLKTPPSIRQGRRRQDRPAFENQLVVENKGGNNYPKNDFLNSQTESEKQVLAETASFAGNGRHRFYNNYDSNTFKTQAPTTAQPSFNSHMQVFGIGGTEQVAVSQGYTFPVNPVPQEQSYTVSQPLTYSPTLTSSSQYYSDTWTQKRGPTTIANYVQSSSTTAFPPSANSFTATEKALFSGKLTSNKDYSFLELHRQNIPTTTSIPSPSPRQYAVVYNNSAAEEIRPEIVNSLVDNGQLATPASAKTLQTLASFYGSTENREPSTIYPRVSDVVLGIHSETTVSPSVSVNSSDLPSVLTQSTKDSYNSLFTEAVEQIDLVKTNDLTPHESNGILPGTPSSPPPNRTAVTNSFVSTTPKDIAQRLKDSVELRELAQVFSRALSAYLEDPEMFKEILAQVRPTEPNSPSETTPSPDDEVLDYSDTGRATVANTKSSPLTTLNQRNDVTNGPVEASTDIRTTSTLYPDYTTIDMTTPSQDYATAQQTTGAPDDQSYFPTAGGVADSTRPRYGGFHDNTRRAVTKSYSPYGADLPENATTGSPLSFSSSTLSPTTIEETTQLPTTHPDVLRVNNLIANNNLLYDQYTASGEDITAGEKLITADSQSFVGGDNYASYADKFNSQRKQYGKDSLSGEDSSYSAEDLVPYFGQEPPFETLAEPAGFNTQASNSEKPENHTLPELVETTWTSIPTTVTANSPSTDITLNPPTTLDVNTVYTATSNPEIIRPTTYHPPHGPLSSRQAQQPLSEEVAARAKEMFGSLNETAASQLMAAMNQADVNPSVRRLVLLLVSEKAVGNRTIEESRSKLIQALLTTRPPPQPRQSRKNYRAVDSDTGNLGVNNLLPELNPSAKLYIPSGTTTTSTAATTTTTTTTTPPPTTLPSTTPTPEALRLSASYPSDARAVELLKTLYNLAARWG